MEVMQHSCWKREHTYAHFNYCFPGELTEKELLGAATEFFEQPDQVLADVKIFNGNIGLEQRESVIMALEGAASSYFFHWDIPFPRKKTEDVVSKLKSLLNTGEIL